MRNPGGYSITTDPEARTIERDTFTCKHCQRIVFVKPFCDAADMGGRCTCCDGLICKQCVAKGYCDHIEEKLLRWEALGKLIESMRES